MGTLCLYTLLVVLHMSSNSVEALPADDGKVLYDSSQYTWMMPAPCVGQTYCFEKGRNYPAGPIKRILQKLTVQYQKLSMDLSSRNGDSPDCPSNSTENPIFYITDNRNKTRVVVQTPELQQIYGVQWCLKEGPITKETTNLLQNTLNNFKFECVNTKMDFDFLVLSDLRTKFEIVKAKGGIPVCCKCRMNVR